MENFLFKSKTIEAHAFKVLIELLHHTLNISCFQIKKDGIYLRQMDSNQKILIDLYMNASNFNFYLYNDDKEHINIGINLSHFFKMLKSVKKRDTIELFITKEEPNDMNIRIIPKDLSRITHSKLKIQNIESLQIDLPAKYNYSILINSLEFSKMLKDMLQISPNLRVRSQKYFIKFYSDIQSIFSREVILGTYVETEDQEPYIYEETFDNEFISKILKVSGLNSNLHIQFEQNMPFQIYSNIGSIGYINLYLKSKKMLEQERYMS